MDFLYETNVAVSVVLVAQGQLSYVLLPRSVPLAYPMYEQ